MLDQQAGFAFFFWLFPDLSRSPGVSEMDERLCLGEANRTAAGLMLGNALKLKGINGSLRREEESSRTVKTEESGAGDAAAVLL